MTKFLHTWAKHLCCGKVMLCRWRSRTSLRTRLSTCPNHKQRWISSCQQECQSSFRVVGLWTHSARVKTTMLGNACTISNHGRHPTQMQRPSWCWVAKLPCGDRSLYLAGHSGHCREAVEPGCQLDGPKHGLHARCPTLIPCLSAPHAWPAHGPGAVRLVPGRSQPFLEQEQQCRPKLAS